MRKFIVSLLALAGATFVGAFGLLLFGMRTQNRAVLTGVRQFNKNVGNKFQMKTAGRPGAWAHVVRHTGRISGRTYETPVVAEVVDDRFVIVLPYGAQADWVKNVLASGAATLVREGETHELGNPELGDISTVIDRLPAKEQAMLRRFGVEQCLFLETVPSAADITAG
jgi:hypothetical protein